MKNILKHPAINAVCISIFSVFYGAIFLITARSEEFAGLFYYTNAKINGSDFWIWWSGFLASGHQNVIAYVTIALTILVVLLLLARRKPYDEYHTALLTNCLTVALVLTLIAIAVFYLVILSEPTGVVEKFTLFAAIHWVTVVLSDLSFVLLCRWR